MGTVADLRRRIRSEHAEAFRLHSRTAALLEPLIARSRKNADAVHIVLDMLFVQAYKTHISVQITAEVGHVEDAATLTRRLQELAVQAVYIGADDQPDVRMMRACKYIADLWDRVDERGKLALPSSIRAEWQSMHDAAGKPDPRRKRWGPTFKEMFEYAERLDSYEQDYKLLSGIAHGSAEDQIMLYSRKKVQVRPATYAGLLLVYASRYYMSVAEIWNWRHRLLDEDAFMGLVADLTRWGDDHGEQSSDEPRAPKGA